MVEHHISITVKAPVHQVYELFTHFNDFPKFMRFIKEVTYYDAQRGHWVVQIAGRHEWDAVNENWIQDRQVGWRSISGLENTGMVTFQQTGPDQTLVNVFLSYNPPAGVLGNLVEALRGGNFDKDLQEDLHRFARMVEEAPPGALDPMSSSYLFHNESAVATGTTTDRQISSMEHDPMMSAQALQERSNRVEQEVAARHQAANERQAAIEQQAANEQQARAEQQAALSQQAALDAQDAKTRQADQEVDARRQQELTGEQDPVLGTLGGRNASVPNTPLGDRDSPRARFPEYQLSPDESRSPATDESRRVPAEEKTISPWRRSIHQGEGPVTAEDTERGE
jgi:hypothetical protein